MNSKFVKKGLMIAAVAGTVFVSVGQASAADMGSFFQLTKSGKEIKQSTLLNVVAGISDNTKKEKTIQIASADEIKIDQMLFGKAVAKVATGEFLTVRSEAKEDSEAVGKLYENALVKVLEKSGVWTRISSGNVEGFVQTEGLISGKDATEFAKAFLEETYLEAELAELDEEMFADCFSVGETIEEEAERLAREEAERLAKEQERLAREQERLAAEEAMRQAELKAKGQAVVDYARQFLGNPYVYGGTSLTRGTDCSGFVKSVYAYFGISMPRSSYYMRNAGYEVSYSEILPGDVICYSGHVGIYAGDGKIINAIDERRGIGYSNARYAKIITIRRMF